ncbi:MAG TPA: tRNA (adenosine(37)-N6)-dimethylallyltransferase MiaA [Gammaproteobacteria bacterium]|nr:tRNA (adenosine(37)-N6)-dimethylallyltransferase MiaA [Gammaproteobacteria bacterium]MBK83391.1 tRNA (adenosine(37)-N6)-dimethylallyltransferase MiaA [Gammaproteobacteria bacterium]MEC8011033.1 tRNA (adenosine(37)-N6)-dimethylallyltransferase MiaA [Pseudomonadota bacterium]HBF08482.1 tRNA (adenosine(37)-N6)-dimethylallyltransferase MiaA [Gammaproteobacteria bacterium]HCK91706.1 tRNA (adenosine(37)-N6)-dimethylallyltransferase MiaA [Gammaproteobacteria bacterium]|tara:strand:- start:4204 stop:5160 length:957 start_codon:yes stop_codon:yes gene_type:complete
MKNKVIFLMGPTAAGKTAAAFKLADNLNVRLISVDSALIYKQMDIGTAKPTKQELAAYPHELVDIRQPQESYSVAEFINDATHAIRDAHSKGQLPVLVGGTMLYFKGLLQGLAPTPTANPEVRAKIQAEIQAKGIEFAHQWLAEVDPESAERLHQRDQQRIERALEIFLSTGEKMSSQYKQDYFQKGWDKKCLEEHEWDILPIALAPPEKKQLHPLIEQRFENMISDGFLDEMDMLMSMDDMHEDLPSMRCVGYRQAWMYLKGETSYDQFMEQGKAATRQLAKRQMTWLRNWTQLNWFDPFQEDCNDRLLELVQKHIN